MLYTKFAIFTISNGHEGRFDIEIKTVNSQHWAFSTTKLPNLSYSRVKQWVIWLIVFGISSHFRALSRFSMLLIYQSLHDFSNESIIMRLRDLYHRNTIAIIAYPSKHVNKSLLHFYENTRITNTDTKFNLSPPSRIFERMALCFI